VRARGGDVAQEEVVLRPALVQLELGVLLDAAQFALAGAPTQGSVVLAALAAQAQVPQWIERMFAGEPINGSEVIFLKLPIA